ncbi:hypothetical protein Chor_010641 [Crotalus horridus]
MGLLSIVSKECASSCTTYYKDMLIVRRNVSCCSSDLCNVGGTSASPTNSAQMAMVAFISFACIILSRLLMEWNGMEWNGMEWSGVEWSGVEWSGVEWSGVEWSGVEYSRKYGMEWSGVE